LEKKIFENKKLIYTILDDVEIEISSNFETISFSSSCSNCQKIATPQLNKINTLLDKFLSAYNEIDELDKLINLINLLK